MAHKRISDPVTSDTYGSKDELTNLNTQLADYIRNVREMRVASVRALGTSHYFETLEKMEGELMQMRGAYETELARMRTEVRETNTSNQTLTQALQSHRGKGYGTQRRLDDAETDSLSLRNDLTSLRVLLAEKDREIVLYKEELTMMAELTNKYKARQATAEGSEAVLETQLDKERKRRLETEENANQLMDTLSFLRQQHVQQEKELQERLKASHNIIDMLDSKLGELSNMGYDQLPDLLNKIRQMTAADMRSFHQQTEENLSKTISTLKRQIEAEEVEKQTIDNDKQVLQNVASSLDETNKNLQAQVHSLRQHVTSLKRDMENDKAKFKTQLSNQHEKQRELQDELISKARAFAHAREAQAELRAEIETYRELLNAEHTRLGYPNKPQYQASLPEITRVTRTPQPTANQYYRAPQPAGQPSLLHRQLQQLQARPAGAATGYPRHWGHLADPSAGPHQMLPPIGHGANHLVGILDTSKSEPKLSNKWNRFETSYKRAFSPEYPGTRRN